MMTIANRLGTPPRPAGSTTGAKAGGPARPHRLVLLKLHMLLLKNDCFSDSERAMAQLYRVDANGDITEVILDFCMTHPVGFFFFLSILLRNVLILPKIIMDVGSISSCTYCLLPMMVIRIS